MRRRMLQVPVWKPGKDSSPKRPGGATVGSCRRPRDSKSRKGGGWAERVPQPPGGQGRKEGGRQEACVGLVLRCSLSGWGLPAGPAGTPAPSWSRALQGGPCVCASVTGTTSCQGSWD